MPGCAALGCSNSFTKGFLMKHFPVDPVRRKNWVLQMRRPNWTPTKYSCICEVHFEPHMWEKTREDGSRRLKMNAVPTLFSLTKLKRPPKSPTNQCGLTTIIVNEKCSLPTASSEPSDSLYPEDPLLLEHKYSDSIHFENYDNITVDDSSTNRLESTAAEPKTLSLTNQYESTTTVDQEFLLPTASSKPFDNLYSEEPLLLEHKYSDSIHFENYKIITVDDSSTNRLESTPTEPKTLSPTNQYESIRTIGQEFSLPTPSSEPSDSLYPEDPLSLEHKYSDSFHFNNYRNITAGDDSTSRPKSPVVQQVVISAQKLENYHRLYKAALLRLQKYKNTVRQNRIQLQRLQNAERVNEKLLNIVFSSDQIKALKRKSTKFMKWSKETIEKALKLRIACGVSGYKELLKQNFPLPSLRTLRRNS